MIERRRGVPPAPGRMVWSPSGGPAPRSKKGPQIADTHRDSVKKSTKSAPQGPQNHRGGEGKAPTTTDK